MDYFISVDGSWGGWGEWGPCTEPCGELRARYRDCDNPMPENGGKHCQGIFEQTKICGGEECKGNG